jgi:hypothetical protein
MATQVQNDGDKRSLHQQLLSIEDVRNQLSNPAISGVNAAQEIIDAIENLRQVEIEELNKKYATKVEQMQQVQTG